MTLTHSLQYLYYRSSVFTTEKKWKTFFKLMYYKVTLLAILSTTSGIEWDKRRPKKKLLISDISALKMTDLNPQNSEILLGRPTSVLSPFPQAPG